MPVREQEVDPNKIFSDLVGVQPTVQRALLGVVAVFATVQPSVGSGGFGVVDDAIGHHVELATDGPDLTSSLDLLHGTLLNVDQDRVYFAVGSLTEVHQLFVGRVDQHTVDHAFRSPQLTQVLLVVDHPCLFHGVVDGVAQCPADQVDDIDFFTLFGLDPARQHDLTKWFHQGRDGDVVLFALVVVVVIDGPDSQSQGNTGLVGNHG